MTIISKKNMPHYTPEQLLERAEIEGIVTRVLSGTINDIVFYMTADGQARVLRCRTRESIFGYEKGYMKEPLIAAFISSGKPFCVSTNEQAMISATTALTKNQPGRSNNSELLPQIVSFDFTRQKLPFPWMIQNAAQGDLLAQKPSEDSWFELGKAIGRLHSLHLLKSGPLDNRSQSSLQRVQAVWECLQQQCPITVRRKFDLEALAADPFSLCHGDVHGNNVIAGSPPTIMDWDNAVVDYPELDIAKPMHWCGKDANGFYTPNAYYHAAYRDGHKEALGLHPNPERLDFYELSWLCRVYAFESQREAAGRKSMPPFPPSASYLKRIRQLAQA